MARAAACLALLALAGACLAGACHAGERGWCRSCHMAYQPRGLGSLGWQGPVQGDALTLCPGLKRAKQELAFTEMRIGALEDWVFRLASRGQRLEPVRAELDRLTLAYHALRKRPVYSVSEISSRLRSFRLELDHKVRRPLTRLNNSRLGAKAWGLASLAGLVFLWLALASYRRRQSKKGFDPIILVREGRLTQQTGRNAMDSPPGDRA